MNQTDCHTAFTQLLEGAPNRETILKIRVYIENLPFEKSQKVLLLTNAARELAAKALHAKTLSATLDSLASELLRPHTVK